MDELSQRLLGFTDGWRCSIFEVLETGPGTALENLSQVQQPKASALGGLLFLVDCNSCSSVTLQACRYCFTFLPALTPFTP
jgi:hypothetical protein